MVDSFCPTDNPDDDNAPHQCRPTDNICHQSPQLGNRVSRLLTIDCGLLTNRTDSSAVAAAISPHNSRFAANSDRNWRKFPNSGVVKMTQLPPIEGRSLKIVKYGCKNVSADLGRGRYAHESVFDPHPKSRRRRTPLRE